ncbi:2,3-diketo-L-gulonate TRAP transporter small permease protein YiaM [Marinomonas spartinae]|uniref:TRAP transporter small permease protein n=1 Tax=Marinomonas spartinae TaxID=1792290 RepID=A0A1A8T3E3_9GAMM|nr:TRAP transporter small permease [Marinomonas spartinae]SBS24746.1 2,3-diketo-L-gulonate TRAP transporter small permease protein YiaM [Marinomonas spartinae]SBS25293.1 2,3-diketo-L-gulonate TRAP transporter small permease protein YiaM [Marinomonas spartinae]
MKLVQGLRWLVRITDWVFATLAVSALLGIVVVVIIQVVSRFMLPSSPIWTEELSRYLFLYLIVFSSGLVIRHNRHVRLELFHWALPPAWHKAYQIFCHVLIGGFAYYILPFALKYVMIGRWQTSPTLEIPMSWIFMSVYVFFCVTVFYSVVCALFLLLDRDNQGAES